jgi:serine/threonine-protein kinase
MAAESLPEFIGPYRVLEELGRGAMGVVYRAEDLTIGREVAVKVVRFDQYLTADEKAQLRMRLMREASAAGKLNHPGIVTVYQLSEHENVVFIAMECVPGVSLEKILAAGPMRDANRVFSILRQVAEALDYAHAAGVIHRDIKPGNILVREDGRAKITDFGIAKIASQHLTQTGMVLGTPSYMAPEQLMAAQIDGKADQFSLAVMAFLMLSGRPPFKADSMAALIFQIVQTEPPPLHELAGQYPAEASAVLSRALAKKAADRFPTCSAFIDALEAACRPAPVTRPAPAASPPRQAPGRSWIWAVAAALAVVAVLIGVAFVARGVRPKTPQAAVQPVERQASAPAPAVQPPPVTPPPALPREKTNPQDGLLYVLIPAGSFEMGCGGGERRCRPDALPPREVRISRSFYLTRTEVTAAAYARFDPTAAPSDLPVTHVAWDDARRFCAWAGGRLPTEAEWEYAARAGQAGPPAGPLEDLAWFGANSGGRAHPAGTRAANAFGLHDMLGNVWEWTADRYSPAYYRAAPPTDPPGPDTGREYVVRGGAAATGGSHLSYAARFAFPPESRDATIGFRCVLP